MKKLFLAIAMLLVASVSFAFDGDMTDDLDKLQKESVKRFKVSKSSGKIGESMTLSEGLSKPYPGKPEEAAREFLKDYHKMFKLSKDLSELKLDTERKSFMGHDVLYRQYHKGILVYRGGASVLMDEQNRAYRVVVGIKNVDDLSVDPAIKPDELQGVLEKTAPEFGPIDSKPSLLIYFVESGPVLAYQFVVFKDQKPYGLIVDSSTGQVLKAFCTVVDEKKTGKVLGKRQNWVE